MPLTASLAQVWHYTNMFLGLVLAALNFGPAEMHGWLATEVESAHVSIGRIKNEYPVFNIDTGLRIDGNSMGYIDLALWTECDLCNHNRRTHRWAFHEIDPKVGYGYRFGLVDGFVFDTSIAAQWNLMSGYYGPAKRSYDEWQIREALETPWFVVYYSMRNFYSPMVKASYRFGLSKSIPLFGGLSFVPNVFCEGGSSRWNTQRFRQHDDWTVGRTINSLLAQMFLDYKVADDLSLYGGVTGYFVVDPDIRDELRSGTGYANRTEFAIVTLGARFVF